MQPVDIGQIVSSIAAMTDAERRAKLSDLYRDSSDDRSDVTMVATAQGLMYRGLSVWAEAAFALAATIPHQANTAQYELGVLWSLQNRLAAAISTFETVRQRVGLSPHQKLYVARQYARVSNFELARTLMDEAVLADQSLFKDSLAELQLYDYLEAYPAVKTFAAYENLRSSYAFADYGTVLAEFRSALENKTPFSIIRIGDGEGIHIRLSADDEKNYNVLYERGRVEIHKVWYAGTQLLNTPEWAREAMKVQEAYKNADCLGMLHEGGLKHEFIIGSPRGIPALNNIIRFLDGIKEEPLKPRMLCDPNIHRFLLLNGDLSRILEGRRFVGLISCYDKLPSRLKAAFQIEEIDLFRTSGEFIARQRIEGEDTGVGFGREFMDSHYHVCRGLESSVRAGELYLVTGGIWGRLYCDMIKRAGGIAVEIGSVADIWMNVGTRHFSAAEMAFTLSDGPVDDHFSRMTRLKEKTA